MTVLTDEEALPVAESTPRLPSKTDTAETLYNKLTDKERAAADAYFKYNDMGKAARSIGYAGKNARQAVYVHLRKPRVKAYIEAKTEADALNVHLTPEGIKQGIAAIASGGKTEANKLRAWELLGKIVGVFKDDIANERVSVVAMMLGDALRRTAGPSYNQAYVNSTPNTVEKAEIVSTDSVEDVKRGAPAEGSAPPQPPLSYGDIPTHKNSEQNSKCPKCGETFGGGLG